MYVASTLAERCTRVNIWAKPLLVQAYLTKCNVYLTNGQGAQIKSVSIKKALTHHIHLLGGLHALVAIKVIVAQHHVQAVVATPLVAVVQVRNIGKVKSIKSDVLRTYFTEIIGDITPTDGILKLYKEILNRQAIKQFGSINTRLEL